MTLIHHLLSLLAFWIKSLCLPQHLVSWLIGMQWGEWYESGLGNNTSPFQPSSLKKKSTSLGHLCLIPLCLFSPFFLYSYQDGAGLNLLPCSAPTRCSKPQALVVMGRKGVCLRDAPAFIWNGQGDFWFAKGNPHSLDKARLSSLLSCCQFKQTNEKSHLTVKEEKWHPCFRE